MAYQPGAFVQNSVNGTLAFIVFSSDQLLTTRLMNIRVLKEYLMSLKWFSVSISGLFKLQLCIKWKKKKKQLPLWIKCLWQNTYTRTSSTWLTFSSRQWSSCLPIVQSKWLSSAEQVPMPSHGDGFAYQFGRWPHAKQYPAQHDTGKVLPHSHTLNCQACQVLQQSY